MPDSNERLNTVTSNKATISNNIIIYCAYGEKKYISNFAIQKNNELVPKWKVFISKMNGGAGTLFDNKKVNIIGESYIGAPNSVCSGALIAIGSFDKQSEALNLQKYLKTMFCRFLIGLMKSSQALYQIVYKYVPLQNFTDKSDIDWSKSVAEIDQQLYAKYNLDETEKAFIKSMIKPME